MQINLLTDFFVLYELSAWQRDDCFVGCPAVLGVPPAFLTHPACFSMGISGSGGCCKTVLWGKNLFEMLYSQYGEITYFVLFCRGLRRPCTRRRVRPGAM